MDIQQLMKSFFARKPSTEQFYLLFVQLAAYYGSGVSILMALHSLQAQVADPQLRQALVTAEKAVSAGRPLSEGLAQSQIFPAFAVQAIYAGEEAGILHSTLIEVANHLSHVGEIEQRLNEPVTRFKLVGSLIGLSGLIACFFVVPKFAELYAQLNIELPLFTRLVVGVIGFAISWWPVVLLGLAGLVYLYRQFVRQNLETIDELKMRIPMFNKLYYLMLQYRLTKMLGLLRSAGVPPIESLEITAAAIENIPLSKLLGRAIRSVRQGMEMSQALAENNRDKLIDGIVLQFIATGEAGGTMSALLEQAAGYYRSRLDRAIPIFSEKAGVFFLSPLVVLLVMVLLAVYLPMLSITQAVQ